MKDESKTGPPPALPPTPWTWRAGIFAGVVGLTVVVFVAQEHLPPQVRSLFGIVCFLGIVAGCSANLRAVNPHTLLWGMALQLALALFVLKVPLGYWLFEQAGRGVARFLEFTDA